MNTQQTIRQEADTVEENAHHTEHCFEDDTLVLVYTMK